MIVISTSSLTFLFLTDNVYLAAIKAQRLKCQQMQEPLKINSKTAELLATQARARGLSVEDYFEELAGSDARKHAVRA